MNLFHSCIDSVFGGLALTLRKSHVHCSGFT